ncbi:MAG: hypothetical protein KTR22_14975 [Flavobacteriaceae bacterium]|nr:hypothetical protein [Flavobacteriaceae bacterium]
MKNVLIIFLITFFVPGCASDTYTDMQIVEEFVSKVIIENPTADVSILEDYLSVKEADRDQTYEYIKAVIPDFHNALKEISNFEIIGVDERSEYASPEHKPIEFKGDGVIYFLVAEGKEEMFFILEKGKIVSFFPNVQKGSNSYISPFVFSE